MHGDYRLDNTMLGDDGRVEAVLDWEICTLGDPLADVGLLMVYWSEAGDELEALPSSPTVLPGFPSRKEVADRYAERSGRDLEPPRLLRRVRVLEAGVHHRGRLRALRRRRHGRGQHRLRALRRPGRASGRDRAGGGRRMNRPMTLYELHARPPLDRPVLVVGMEGWIDAGLGASTAMATLLASVTTEPVATFDVDTLLDHRARRPIVRIVDGVNTGLRWPEIELRGGHDADGHDLLLLVGPEPDHQWRAFTAAVGELAMSFGVSLVSASAPSPRPCRTPARPGSRPPPPPPSWRSASASCPARSTSPRACRPRSSAASPRSASPRSGCGPACRTTRRRCPTPRPARCCSRASTSVAGITADTADLRRAAEASRQHLDELIANSEEHIALVRQLETQVDADVPSGDEIAAEVERFLRGEGSGA